MFVFYGKSVHLEFTIYRGDPCCESHFWSSILGDKMIENYVGKEVNLEISRNHFVKGILDKQGSMFIFLVDGNVITTFSKNSYSEYDVGGNLYLRRRF